MVNNLCFESDSKSRRRAATLRRAVVAAVLLLATASAAAAADQMYFSANDNVENVLIQYINQETVRLDISAWYLTDHNVSVAIANRFAAGVPVRLIGDRGAIFEIDPHTKAEFYWLANLGVPIRLRFNPTWYPEIDHWKAAIFKGQGVVEFGSANYTPYQLAPYSSTNYSDETAMFTDDPTLVGAFETKFDVIWNDTTTEPESLISAPPYVKSWYDACANEPTGCDFSTQYPNPAPMNVNTARLEPDNPMPADLIWGQGPDFNNRQVTEINNESTAIDYVIYRLTVDNITQALLAKQAAGIPIRVIMEPAEYMNRKFPEFWLTHANIDKLWASGVQVEQRIHDGITHMKVLITSNYATNASSNNEAHWQRDHDYFVPAATKPDIYAALKNQFQAMWTNTSGFGPFTPVAADATTQVSPASGATGVATSATLTWNTAAFATSYDIYLGTNESSMALVGNVPAQLNDSPPTTYSFTANNLAGNTTYYWKVASRTFATDKDPSIIAYSNIQSFTTGASSGGGGTGGTLPSPWTDEDIGSTGLAGSASYSSGAFSVSGAGSDIWGADDSFNFVSQPVNGDGQIIARVSAEQNTSSYAKAGVMFRDSDTATASNVILDVRPDGTIEFMARAADGGTTSFVAGGSQAFPAWLKLVRSGSTFTGSVSADGSTWTTIGTTTATLNSAVSVGLAVTSHDTSTLNTSTFDNVAVTGGTSGGGGGGTLPSPWVSNDVGSTGMAGSGSYSSGTFTVQGSGADIWGTADAFQYVNQPLSGDGQIVARVTGEQNTNTYAKAGVMLRGSLNAGDADVILDVRPDGSVEFMSRPSSGAATNYIAGATQAFPTWLMLARSGNTVTGSVSANGSTWTTVGTTTVTMASGALIGMAVTSHDTTMLNSATFDNVAVTTAAATTAPAAPGSPSPTNAATGVSTTPTLTWSSSGATSYDVAFGTANPPATVSTGQTGASYTPSALSTNTTYYWQIVAHNSVGSTTGPVWSFTTAAAPPSNIVVYASDVQASSIHGVWSATSDASAANGIKLATPDNGTSNTSAALASPADYVDVTFNAVAGTPYTFWIRLQALNNSKYNDSIWVQFSDAQVNGSAAYQIGSTNALDVNLATDGTGSSDSGWGWVDGAYWLTQAATVTFPTSGSHTVRVQVREDGVQFDQIVLSPTTYFNSSASCPNSCTGAPGPVSNDSTIVPKS